MLTKTNEFWSGGRASHYLRQTECVKLMLSTSTRETVWKTIKGEEFPRASGGGFYFFEELNFSRKKMYSFVWLIFKNSPQNHSIAACLGVVLSLHYPTNIRKKPCYSQWLPQQLDLAIHIIVCFSLKTWLHNKSLVCDTDIQEAARTHFCMQVKGKAFNI